MTDHKVLNVDQLAKTIGGYDALSCKVIQTSHGRYRGVAYVFGTSGHFVPVQLEILLERNTISFGLEGVVIHTQEQVIDGLGQRKEISVTYQTQQPPQKCFMPLGIGEVIWKEQQISQREPERTQTPEIHVESGGVKYAKHEKWGEYKIPEFSGLVKSTEIYVLFIDKEKSKAAQQLKLQRWVNNSKFFIEMKDYHGNNLPQRVYKGKKPYFTNEIAKELTKALIKTGLTYYGNSFCI